MPAEYERIYLADPRAFGDPRSPTPEGFAALARAGRDVRNEWRRVFPTRRDESGLGWMHAVRWRQDRHPAVPLNSADLSDFSGFEFGDGADFHRIDFDQSAACIGFDGATFRDEAFNMRTIPSVCQTEKKQCTAPMHSQAADQPSSLIPCDSFGFHVNIHAPDVPEFWMLSLPN